MFLGLTSSLILLLACGHHCSATSMNFENCSSKVNAGECKFRKFFATNHVILYGVWYTYFGDRPLIEAKCLIKGEDRHREVVLQPFETCANGMLALISQTHNSLRTLLYPCASVFYMYMHVFKLFEVILVFSLLDVKVFCNSPLPGFFGVL